MIDFLECGKKGEQSLKLHILESYERLGTCKGE